MAPRGSAADCRSRPAQSRKRRRRRCSAAGPRAPRPPESPGSVSCRSPGSREERTLVKRLQNSARSFDFAANYAVNFKRRESLELTYKKTERRLVPLSSKFESVNIFVLKLGSVQFMCLN